METVTEKPTEEEIKKWVIALRSGKYKQTSYRLQDKYGYCCLGVACDIFIPKNKLKIKGKFMIGQTPGYQKNSPYWLRKINMELNLLIGKPLAGLNDKEALSFDEIADVLELIYIHKALD